MRLAVIAGSSGSGGYQRYINGIFRRGNVPTSVETNIFCSSDLAQKLNDLDERVELHVDDGFRQGAVSFCFRRMRSSCVHQVDRFAPDVVFFTNGFIQKGLEAYPAVVTFHNMLMLDFAAIAAQGLSRTTLLWLLLAMKQRASFKKADGVIFMSPYSQATALRKMPWIQRSIVVPHGLDKGFRASGPAESGLKDKVRVLYLSTLYKYKHQLEVIRAVRLLHQRRNMPVELSLVGDGDSKYAAKLQQEINRLGAAEYIHLMGDAAHETLPEMIDTADIFLYASSSETFGIILLEGMGRGAVIACSNRSGLPDLLRDGGEYFDPRDPESICEALERLIDSHELRRDYAARALAISKEYTWERSAKATFAFIEEIAGAAR